MLQNLRSGYLVNSVENGKEMLQNLRSGYLVNSVENGKEMRPNHKQIKETVMRPNQKLKKAAVKTRSGCLGSLVQGGVQYPPRLAMGQPTQAGYRVSYTLVGVQTRLTPQKGYLLHNVLSTSYRCRLALV
jgi:hypothetical protein